MFCEELYHILSLNSNSKSYKLTFAPNQPGFEGSFFVSQESTGVEIVCFKNTYLSIFKEAHDYFKNYQLISACPKNKDTYYASLGYLLTTPENKTNFNVHYDTFLKLWLTNEYKDLLDNELKIVQRLLASSNNRLNKSSSLWLMYKKLYSLLVKYNKTVKHNYILTFLESGAKHPSNYYCWNTSKWFFDALPFSQRKHLIDGIEQFCFRNFKDSSAWDALAYMLCQPERNKDYNVNPPCHSSNVDQAITHSDCHGYEFSIDDKFKEISQLIDSFSVAELPPFLCCRTISMNFPQLKVIKITSKKWKSDIDNFERKHGQPQYIRKNPISEPKYADDVIISGFSKHIGYKKRFVENNL